MVSTNRRTVIGGMLAGAAASGLGLPAWAQDQRIRHYWWGNPDRDARTYAVIEQFEADNPGVEVAGETVAWGDYWTKLATQAAGGNMADLVQMDYRYIFEYVRRGALLPLDEYMGNTLDLSGFDEGGLDGGMLDGKLYAVNIGANSQVCVFNTRMVEEAGAEFDPITWTYEDHARVAQAIADATPEGVYGSDDNSIANVVGLECWLQQHGRPFYDAEGDVQVSAQDVIDYWKYWDELRKSGAVRNPEATISLLNASMAEAGIVTGATAMSFYWSNQIVGVQSLMQDKVGAAMFPHLAGGEPGQFIKPSMFLSMTRDTANPELATKYIDNWVKGPEATRILGLERGIPLSADVREALIPDLNEPELVSIEYFEAIQPHVGPLPPPQPNGAGEVEAAYQRIGSEVILGRTSIEDGASEFVEMAERIIKRAS
jgi:multiple sugar transport system substrate-binding protein